MAILAAVSAYEAARTRARTRASIRHRRALGKPVGPAVYGTEGGEAALVERIVSLRAEGMGYRSIARTMNAEGQLPRRGRWHATSVKRVIERAAA
tara:strand:- start:3493 stop:3777 length:285 start_codon:yes stop_codon:yes gene_type:complete